MHRYADEDEHHSDLIHSTFAIHYCASENILWFCSVGVATLDGYIEVIPAHHLDEFDTILPVYSARSPVKAEEFGGGGVKTGIVPKVLNVSSYTAKY